VTVTAAPRCIAPLTVIDPRITPGTLSPCAAGGRAIAGIVWASSEIAKLNASANTAASRTLSRQTNLRFAKLPDSLDAITIALQTVCIATVLAAWSEF